MSTRHKPNGTINHNRPDRHRPVYSNTYDLCGFLLFASLDFTNDNVGLLDNLTKRKKKIFSVYLCKLSI